MKRVLPAIFVAILGACASGGEALRVTTPAAPQPMAEGRPAPSIESLSESPDLAEVLAFIDQSPTVGVGREAVLREEALREQAGLPPNPILNLFANRIETDDILGGPDKYRVSLRERIETAGKRDARVQVGAGLVGEANAEVRALRFRSARAAAGAHQRAVSSRELRTLIAAARDSASALLAIEEQLVAAGREQASILPSARERVAALETELLEEEARSRSALRNLEGIVAAPPGAISAVGGDLLLGVRLPPAVEETFLDENPALEVARAAVETAEARMRAARASPWPDVTVGVDYEHARELGDQYGFLGVSLEADLPVLDTKGAAIRAAHADLRRARMLVAEVKATAGAAYAEAREVAETLSLGAKSRRTGVIPAREQEVEFARAAFRSGRTDLRPVLRAEFALLRARIDLVQLEERVAARNLDALALLGLDPEAWSRPADL
jgi:outer membrane protein, heavy metal efflux system